MDVGRLRYATFLLNRTVREAREQQRAAHAEAMALFDEGRLTEAAARFEQLLAVTRDNAVWWGDWASLLTRLGRHADASSALLHSLTLDSTNARTHVDFGSLLDKPGVDRTAWDAYASIVGLEGAPDSPMQAIKQLPQLIRDEAEAARVRGHLNLVQRHIPEAIAAYEWAHRSRPDSRDLTRSLATALRLAGVEGRSARLLGHLLFQEGRHKRALVEFERAHSFEPLDAASWVEWAASFRALSRYDDAISTCRAGLERHPRELGLYRELADALQRINDIDGTIAVAIAGQRALSDPGVLSADRYLTLPVVCDSESEMREHRARLADGLCQLTDGAYSGGVDRPSLSVEDVRPNFYLGYHAQNDRALQTSHGALIHRVMSDARPHWAGERSMPTREPAAKIRVGYVFDGNSGIDLLFLGWLEAHDRTRFELCLYQVGGVVGPSSHPYAMAGDHFDHLPHNLDVVCGRIVEDDLHVLVYFHIGMSPLFSRMASLRLVPVQCAAWGHPMTTGLPTIDYFISNQAMEPDDAADHYSETLEQLPGIGVSLQRPFLPKMSKTRADFGLGADEVAYLCCQAPSKYLPQHDHVFADIAGRVPSARFVLIDKGPAIVSVLRRRLERAFRNAGLNADTYIRFIPEQEYYDYLELCQLCDVFLDTFGWSGAITTLDAVGCALPVVTMPGALMRGRQSYGILTQLGVTDTIATDVGHYVDLAVRLGLEPAWRRRIGRQMRDNHSRLFEDRACVPALEAFYDRIVSERTAWQTSAFR